MNEGWTSQDGWCTSNALWMWSVQIFIRHQLPRQDFHCFRQPLQKNVALASSLYHNFFLPNPFQLITHRSSYNLIPCSLDNYSMIKRYTNHMKDRNSTLLNPGVGLQVVEKTKISPTTRNQTLVILPTASAIPANRLLL
jgi:hypothetical protein